MATIHTHTPPPALDIFKFKELQLYIYIYIYRMQRKCHSESSSLEYVLLFLEPVLVCMYVQLSASLGEHKLTVESLKDSLTTQTQLCTEAQHKNDSLHADIKDKVDLLLTHASSIIFCFVKKIQRGNAICFSNSFCTSVEAT